MVERLHPQSVHKQGGSGEGRHRARSPRDEPRVRGRLAVRLDVLREDRRVGQLQGVRQEGDFLHPDHRLELEVRRVRFPRALLRQGQDHHHAPAERDLRLSRPGVASPKRRRDALHQVQARGVCEVCSRARHDGAEPSPHPAHQRLHRQPAGVEEEVRGDYGCAAGVRRERKSEADDHQLVARAQHYRSHLHPTDSDGRCPGGRGGGRQMAARAVRAQRQAPDELPQDWRLLQGQRHRAHRADPVQPVTGDPHQLGGVDDHRDAADLVSAAHADPQRQHHAHLHRRRNFHRL